MLHFLATSACVIPDQKITFSKNSPSFITIPPLLSLATKVLLNYADCANLIFVGKRQCILVSLDFIKETVTILATINTFMPIPFICPFHP